MALTQVGADSSRAYNEDLVATAERINPGIVENSINAHPAMSVLFGNIGEVMTGPVGSTGASGSMEVVDGGDSVRVNVKLGKSGAARRLASGFSEVSTDTTDNARGGRSNWKLYATPFIISGSQKRRNGGMAKMIDQLVFKQTDAVTSLVDLLAEDLLTSSSAPNAIASIPTLISANDTVGGLSGATFQNWNSRGLQDKGTAAGTIDFTPTVVSWALSGIANWRVAYMNAEEGSKKPNVIITTDAIYRYYEGSLTPQVRYQDHRVGDLSFESLRFKGASVFHDPYCASGETYFLNTQHIKATVLRGAAFDIVPPERRDSQDAFAGMVLFEGQLIVDARKYHNKIDGQTA